MSETTPARLAVEDYVVFGITLGVSAFIGIFFAIKDRNSDKGQEDYLVGGRSLSMVPVALSLAVSFMSAITVLGAPAEVYIYGTMYWWFLLAMFIVTVVTSEVFIPVFYNMNILSTYEYLERRFNTPVKILTTLVYVIENIFYIGIVIYAPSLALNAVTGFSLWGAILSTGFVCIFYTALGGIKAVIWTDVFQAVIMLAGFLAVTIQGSIQLNGFAEAWRIADENNRIDFFRFDFDPRIRHSVWSVVVGGTFLWLGIYGVSQSQVQRYIACKSEKQAKGSIFLNWIGLVIIISLSMINGIIMYAYFAGCDPLSTGEISASDQLLPLLALKLFANQPGVPGLIISGVFSGSLSTVSSGINSMACVTIEDFIKPCVKMSERKYTWITKILVVVFGLLCIGMAYVASQLGGVLEAALSILGLVAGPIIALFTMGLIFPFANSIGAFVAVIVGLAFPIWIYIGSEIYPPADEFVRVLSVSTADCPVEPDNTTMISSVTTSIITTTTEAYPPIANLYAVSYSYYACLGFAASLLVGLVLSLVTGGWSQRKKVDPKLLHFVFDHWMFSWLPEKFRSIMRCGITAEKKTESFVWEKSHSAVLQNYYNLNGTAEKVSLENAHRYSNANGSRTEPTFATFVNGGFVEKPDGEMSSSL